MAEAKLARRPLSPHLQIYRWTWTMAMSVVHRVTGGALYVGTILVAVWLSRWPPGPAAYAGAVVLRLAARPPDPVRLHLDPDAAHARRHPPSVWDFGYGMEPATRIAMARVDPDRAVALTLLIWLVALWSAERVSESTCSRAPRSRTMVDNRPDTRVSMRTPLARVKGLGAAGHGVEHWWIHRVTAVANVPLIIAFVVDRGDARRPPLCGGACASCRIRSSRSCSRSR